MTVRFPSAADSAAWGSADWPLGAVFDPGNNRVTFAVQAPAATRVQLEIFGRPLGREADLSVVMSRSDDGLWRAAVDNLGPGAHYGFRVWGRNWEYDEAWVPGSAAGFVADLDADGNRFNPNKLLFDPYAREISHTTDSRLIVAAGFDAGMFGTGGQQYRGAARREFDTAPWAPKGIVISDTTPTGTRPRIPAENAAIYEAHVQNLTMHSASSRLSVTFRELDGLGCVADVPAAMRGTYAGAALMAEYVRSLGMTTIELLPVQQVSSESMPGVENVNHWGYQSIGFFAPVREYSLDQEPGGPTREFKQMVKAFHDAGLEVYLDVVYNHTGEGGQWGGDVNTTGFVSMGGFATAEYYELDSQKRLIDGATGTSNQTNMGSRIAQQLVTDSLIYWSDVMGVDGFRFDLAPVLGRTPNGVPGGDRTFHRDHPLLIAIRELAEERDLEVIAEAWDLWGYEVGNFPAGWGEWNGRYRDAVRAFLKGDGNALEFVAMVNGDFDHFCHGGGPQRSINFVDAHDGLTMTDLVSYNGKHNDQPYPFGPSDGGSDDNRSWDSGGDHALRRQRLRNFWAVLFLSRGVPMVVSGDEYGRTQNGNNNPWAINTVGMWNNWDQVATNAPDQVPVDPDGLDPRAVDAAYHDNLGESSGPTGVNPVLGFARYLTQFRAAHSALRQRTYGDAVVGNADVSYLFGRPDGSPLANGDRAIRLLIDASGTGDANLLVLINMLDSDVSFSVPDAGPGRSWRLVMDTAHRSEAVGNTWPLTLAPVVHDGLMVPRWSLAVLESVPTLL